MKACYPPEHGGRLGWQRPITTQRTIVLPNRWRSATVPRSESPAPNGAAPRVPSACSRCSPCPIVTRTGLERNGKRILGSITSAVADKRVAWTGSKSLSSLTFRKEMTAIPRDKQDDTARDIWLRNLCNWLFAESVAATAKLVNESETPSTPNRRSSTTGYELTGGPTIAYLREEFDGEY